MGSSYLDNQDFPAPVCDFSPCAQVLVLPGHPAERGRASCQRLSENEVLETRGVLHRLDLVPQVSELQHSAGKRREGEGFLNYLRSAKKKKQSDGGAGQPSGACAIIWEPQEHPRGFGALGTSQHFMWFWKQGI